MDASSLDMAGSSRLLGKRLSSDHCSSRLLLHCFCRPVLGSRIDRHRIPFLKDDGVRISFEGNR